MNDTITNLIADIRNWEKNAKKNSADPKIAEACSALVPVLDSIATRLEQLIKDGFYVTPEAARKFAEEQAKKDEELSFEAEAKLAKKRRFIGNCANNRHIMSWNYYNELDIVCRVVGGAEENNWWEFSLESLGLVRAHGTIRGGKGLAICLAKAMRNGLTSFRMHRRKTKSNRVARKSAELAASAKEEK